MCKFGSLHITLHVSRVYVCVYLYISRVYVFKRERELRLHLASIMHRILKLLLLSSQTVPRLFGSQIEMCKQHASTSWTHSLATILRLQVWSEFIFIFIFLCFLTHFLKNFEGLECLSSTRRSTLAHLPLSYRFFSLLSSDWWASVSALCCKCIMCMYQ